MQSIGGQNSDLGRDTPEVTPVEISETCGGCRLGYDARKAPFVGGTRDNQASISTGSSLKQEAPRKLGTIGLQASEHVSIRTGTMMIRGRQCRCGYRRRSVTRFSPATRESCMWQAGPVRSGLPTDTVVQHPEMPR
jgi:hypothetical protein